MQLWCENMEAFATILKDERMAVTDMCSCHVLTNIKMCLGIMDGASAFASVHY